MVFFARSVAPIILYGCSVLLVLAAFQRFRADSPLKGLLDLVGAATIAIIAWNLGGQ